MANKPQLPQEGVLFPVSNDKGERSTTEAGKKIFAESIRNIDPQLAEDILKERNWRNNYAKYIKRHVVACLSSPEAALQAAKAGLEWMHQNFDFVRDGQSMKFAEAMKAFKGTYHTGIIKGRNRIQRGILAGLTLHLQGKKPRGNTELVIPYKGRQLKGDEILQQVKKWADKGTIEPSAAEAISMVVKNPKWTDLSDRYFVLLGAGSAMGPYLVLTALGANIIALDLDRPHIWKRLITIAEDSPCTITFPLKKPQSEIKTPEELYENAGANLITHAPEILNWVQDLYKDKPLVIGCYVYLDGEAHVKVVLACDAIIRSLNETRKAAVAFLCTPTDVHVIPDEARKAALANYNSLHPKNLALMPLRLFTGRKMLAKNVEPPVKAKDGTQFNIVDALIVPQGPNYALAKRMQHWRVIIARSVGCITSSHIAPSTSTASVVSNKTFAFVFGGIEYFNPIEIFQQDTSNAVMSAILIHDLNNPNAVAHPQVPLRNPLELFSYNSFNGGVWRCGYTFGSIGEVSALVYVLKKARPALLILAVVLVAILYQKYFA